MIGSESILTYPYIRNSSSQDPVDHVPRESGPEMFNHSQFRPNQSDYPVDYNLVEPRPKLIQSKPSEPLFSVQVGANYKYQTYTQQEPAGYQPSAGYPQSNGYPPSAKYQQSARYLSSYVHQPSAVYQPSVGYKLANGHAPSMVSETNGNSYLDPIDSIGYNPVLSSENTLSGHNSHQTSGYKSQLPGPIGYTSQMADSIRYQTHNPNPIGYEPQLSESIGYRPQLPEPIGYRPQLPEPSGYRPKEFTLHQDSASMTTQSPVFGPNRYTPQFLGTNINLRDQAMGVNSSKSKEKYIL